LKLGQLIQQTEKRFKAARLHYGHGTDSAHGEAVFLVIRGLDLPFSASDSIEVDPSRVEKLIGKRIAQRIPAAYLLKEAWLDGQPFYVDERVLVPRSHIAFILKDLETPKRVLDLCTGSGCLAILAARAYSKAAVVGSDISTPALAVAKENVKRHGLGRRVRLVRSDLFKAIEGRFDVIITNPPYVDMPAMRKLPPEYLHEPRGALAAGRDGLDLVRTILGEARDYLTPNGLLLCEVGDSRPALERAYPGLDFAWPHDSVFLLQREALS
jgi:ribosomal protein L3 glutamine methyltransferase